VLNAYTATGPEREKKLLLPKEPFSILFVCTANICRSPTAESVMRKQVEEAGLKNRIILDSAGTHDYYVGEPPDVRAQAAARRHGYDLASLRARQIQSADFEVFDLLLAMDMNNLAILKSMCPQRYLPKVRLLMDYARRESPAVVEDPFSGTARQFETALGHIEEACIGLMDLLMYGRITRR
jgi:protein-tyrosine phosphatase